MFLQISPSSGAETAQVQGTTPVSMPLTGYKTRRYSGPADYSQIKQKRKRINSLGSRISLLGLHTGSATSCKTLDKSCDFSVPQFPHL